MANLVNSNDLRSHLVSIDSRFRKSKLEPPTNFQYEFAHPYKNVIKARVASVEIPIGFYNFSDVKRNTMFRIDIMDYTGVVQNIVVHIDEGDYTPETLITQIQTQFNAIQFKYGIFLQITLDLNTHKVTIKSNGSSQPNSPGATYAPNTFAIMFGMLGLESRTYDFGLGYNLGFISQTYSVGVGTDGTYSITSESIISTQGDTYFLLGMDDFYTVEHKTSENYITCLAKILIKRNSSGIIFDDGYTVLSNDIVFPRPTDLKQVRIRLMDCYGETIDLHHLNLSISLEITEVMNVKLYESVRNSVWKP
jgi:hypothetical protein